MTVKDLIEELKRMPEDKDVEIATLGTSYGEAMRVIEYDDFVEIESNEN
jgi:hypothetical protein